MIENQLQAAPFGDAENETTESVLRDLPATDVAELERHEAGRKVAQMCRATDELKALGIAVLDVRKQTIIADFFVICSGTSSTHIRSIAGHVQDKMREIGLRAKPEGDGDSQWVVMDYGDAILHVLSEETREFYDLERLWADAQISLWPEAVSTPLATNNSSQLK